MPRAHGSDRVSEGPEGTVLLSCRLPKGWKPRAERTLRTHEHPGTAVDWDGAWYEVLEVGPLPGGGVRYTLAPWRDEHVIRLAERYDEEAERSRAAHHRSLTGAEAKRKRSILLAPLAGHLPANVQEHMQDSFGAPARLLTLASIVPPGFYGLACLSWMLAERMRGARPPLPGALVSIGILLLAESFLRLVLLLMQNRPVGSFEGSVAYSIWYLGKRDRRGLVEPSCVPEELLGRRGGGTRGYSGSPAPPDVAAADRYRMIEPYLAFLSAAEQRFLQERYGFDPLRWGRRTAWTVLVLSGAGLVSDLAGLALGRTDLVTVASLLAALALGVEQVLRLATLRTGPAGSALGLLVRPFARLLFEDRAAR